MAINFPTNPNEGDTHNWQGISYKYDITDDTWRRVHATYYVAEHEHDGRYYTETEIDNILSWRDQQLASGQLDTRYYTEVELDGGQLDNRYYTETEADDRFVNVTGDIMSGILEFNTTGTGINWSMNTDGASILFYNTGDQDADSRLEFGIRDNDTEYFRWVAKPSGGTTRELLRLRPNGHASLASTMDVGGNLNVAGSAGVSGNLSVSGWIRAVDDVYAYYGITDPSDARLKDEITQIPDALSSVMSLHGVTFVWNDSAKDIGIDSTKRHVGVLAQEVNAVLPEATTVMPNTDYMAVKYDKLVPLLIEAIKEQQEQIIALQQRIDRLEE